MNSRLLLAAVFALVLLISAIIFLLKITTKQVPDHLCPQCGTVTIARLHPDATAYFCPKCQYRFVGPARNDFSWGDAFEAWASEAAQ